MPPLVRALLSHVLNSPLKRLWWPAFQRRMPAIMRRFMTVTPIREVREMWVNWIVDGKTRATCTVPPGSYRELDKFDAPFVTVQNLGMFNLHQFGSYELFQKAATPKNRKWLIMTKPEYELPAYGWHAEAIAFFDHVVRGADNSYAGLAPVRYWVDGAERLAVAENFPVPGSEAMRLYLASVGDDSAVHGLADRPASGSNRWAAIPLGAPVLSGIDEVMNQQLVYEMRVDRMMELAGPVTANLTFSSNEIDSYVLARLSRVDPTGGDHLLSLGAICPSRRRLDPARGSAVEIAIDTDVREPLVPGEPVVLRFSLTPGPVQLMPGERLRLTIASRTDLVESDTAHDHAHFNLKVPPYFSRNTLHYGEQTYVELHKVSGAWRNSLRGWPSAAARKGGFVLSPLKAQRTRARCGSRSSLCPHAKCRARR